jgi:hypothetical protein
MDEFADVFMCFFLLAHHACRIFAGKNSASVLHPLNSLFMGKASIITRAIFSLAVTA